MISLARTVFPAPVGALIIKRLWAFNIVGNSSMISCCHRRSCIYLTCNHIQLNQPNTLHIFFEIISTQNKKNDVQLKRNLKVFDLTALGIAAIIGAGISGLFIANLLKENQDYQVTIYEKNNSIDLVEGYGIQLSTNSIKLLNKIGFNTLEDGDRFNPEKIDFYTIKPEKKICNLNISDFNTEDCKYTTIKRSKLIEIVKDRINSNIIKYDQNIEKIEKK